MTRWLISAEHAGREIPEEVRIAFVGQKELLQTHHAFDPGTAGLWEAMQGFADAAFINRVSRLVVETNRSLHHPRLFSAVTANLPEAEQAELLAHHYHPHRQEIFDWVAAATAEGHRVCHVGLHSFTPVWQGKVRPADVALLYDPQHPGEKELAASWLGLMHKAQPAWRLRRNYPYLGKADGLTTALRRRFGAAYRGLELEVNQAFAVSPEAMDPALTRTLVQTFQALRELEAGAG